MFPDDASLELLRLRMPNAKDLQPRLPHMVSYLLEELPLFLTGTLHQGVKHQTMLYSTESEHALIFAKLIHEFQTFDEFESLRQEIYNSSSTTATTGLVSLTYGSPEPQHLQDYQDKAELKRNLSHG